MSQKIRFHRLAKLVGTPFLTALFYAFFFFGSIARVHSVFVLRSCFQARLWSFSWVDFRVCQAISYKLLTIPLNFQRWMSWLVQRWRTQRTAIRSVNCRIQWIIRLLNAKGAVEVFSWQHVCFSVSWLPLKVELRSFSRNFSWLCN